MEEQHIHNLVQQFLEGTLSPAQQQEFYLLLKDPAQTKTVTDALEALSSDVYFMDTADNRLLPLLQIATAIDKPRQLPAQSTVPVRSLHKLWKWGWAAASIIILVCAGTWFLLQRSQQAPAHVSRPLTADIAPGKDGAILTLANGQQVVLDSLGNGVIANQNGSQAILKNGQLTYDPAEKTSGETVYNTMSTPKGRQFHLKLPDGSDVWLNAASSIRFPTAFNGRQRNVELMGEAYFEIVPNAKMPFHVIVNNRENIEVVGTHFNVNAYETENSLNTTVLKGAVRVSAIPALQAGGNTVLKSVLLQPGQQARMAADITVVNDVDTDKIMAWKNGLFNFEGVGLHELARQLERWYDITIIFDDKVPDIEFGGEMSRNVPLSDVLHTLENYGVHFRLEEQGHKLIILR